MFGGRMTVKAHEQRKDWVCPWWLGYALISPVRRLMHDPHKILVDHLAEGMTAFEPGPGMGFFTLEMARLVGPHGRVVAVDVQSRMLEKLARRAQKSGLASRIETRTVVPDELGSPDLAGRVDFVLAFAVVHEIPEAETFFRQCARYLKPKGRLLFAEPAGHVSQLQFAHSLALAAKAGFGVIERPKIFRSHAVVLEKSDVA
jgi:SAM-dependent methyltransferase